MRRQVMLALALWPAFAAHAVELADATGRTVALPDHIARVLPAGPPAAVLMEVLAPDLMVGWPRVPSPEALAWLPPMVRALPATPGLTGREDLSDGVPPLHPDLILDWVSLEDLQVSRFAGLEAVA